MPAEATHDNRGCSFLHRRGRDRRRFHKHAAQCSIGLWLGLQYEGEQIDSIKDRLLFICTDGLNDAENRQQCQFGDERLSAVLCTVSFNSALQVVEALNTEVERHRNGAEPNDDLTMMCLKTTC